MNGKISFDNHATTVQTAGAPLALVIDDDLTIRRLLRRVLEVDGLRVIEAADGYEGLEAAAGRHPDIILLDIMMDGLDGIAACSQLRALPGAADVPIVMITAMHDDTAINAAYAAGATDYLVKPPNLAAMRQRVRTLLRARQAETALRASEERARAIVEAVGDPLIILDRDDRICRWNPAAERVFGYAAPEAVGQSISLLCPGPEAGCQGGGAEALSARGTPGSGALTLGEVILRRRDGSLVHAEVNLSAFVVDGELFRACVMRDLTERKQMQEQMLIGQKFADLGTLAAGVAHEINSPLQVITGASRSLLRRLDGCPAGVALDGDLLRSKLELIHRSGWRCAEIVRALLTYAHPANQGAEESSGHSRYDLQAVVQDTLLLIRHQLESWSNITVTTDLAPELPALPCDRNQISQVLINLLVNARDAMPSGGEITIRTRLAPEEGCLLLTVADTGYGIPPATQQRIFDPFFTTKPLGQGTGLGLSIVAGIVKAHGGKIALDSAPGRGTLFNITLPVDEEVGMPSTADAVGSGAGGPGSPGGPGSHTVGRFDER